MRFIEINAAVARLLDGAKNPTVDSLVDLLKRRSAALCETAPSGAIGGWSAIVASYDKDRRQLTLLVGPKISVEITNFDDLESILLMGDVEIGEAVRISGSLVSENGHCFRQESDLTVEALSSPTFVLNLSALTAAGQ